MSKSLMDRHQIFATRLKCFKAAIERYKSNELQKIAGKGEEEEKYEVHKLKLEAANKDTDIYSRMEKNIAMSQKIAKSRLVNESRMRKMKARFELVEKVQEQTKDALLAQTKNQTKYRELLKLLIMQGLIKLLEEKVEIRCLKRDLAVIKELAIECEQEFGQTSLVPTYIKINEHHFLDTSSIGGVILTSFSGRIVCDNTLKSRLDYALQLALPVVRKMLFAQSDQLFAEKRHGKKQNGAMHKSKAQAHEGINLLEETK